MLKCYFSYIRFKVLKWIASSIFFYYLTDQITHGYVHMTIIKHVYIGCTDPNVISPQSRCISP